MLILYICFTILFCDWIPFLCDTLAAEMTSKKVFEEAEHGDKKCVLAAEKLSLSQGKLSSVTAAGLPCCPDRDV
ncbi:unnamed protein product, partial [Bubo scandiacus]